MNSVTLEAQWSLISYIKNFSYTGAAQTFTAPYTGYYKVELWGAQGGNYSMDYASYGGYVAGTSIIDENASLYVYIGQKGTCGKDYTNGKTSYTTYNGVFNSGGNVYTLGDECFGGGSSDIRATSGAWSNAASLRSRIMVAGGSGTTTIYPMRGPNSNFDYTYNTQYTFGGGLSAGSWTTTVTYYKNGGASGGTQISGGRTYNTSCGSTNGSFGIGGNGYGNGAFGSTGGGGWYGGGGGCDAAAGSGGGSSYISGHTGSVAVASTSSSSPKSGCTTGTTNNACSISPYGYTFTDTVMIDGAGYKWTNVKGALQQMPNPSGGYYASGVGHNGNGYAKITWLGS